MCFFDAGGKGDSVIKVHSFKTGEILTVYKFSVNDLVDFWPSISNHGDKIGFWLKEISGNSSLYIINTDGSNLEKITTAANGHWVLWCPDDKKIVFAGSLAKKDMSEKDGSLYIVDIKNKKVKVIIDRLADGITNQSVSPDGQRILYGYKGAIITYDFSTNKSRKIAKGDWFAWSPRGDWIAYLEEEKLNIINPETLEKRTLLETDGISAPLYWLPNGEYIVYGVFTRDHAEIGDPYIVRVSDKKIESISENIWMLASWAKESTN